MPFTFANRGLFRFMNSAMSASTDIRQAVFTGTAPSEAAIRDMNTLADLIADAGSAESVAAGYGRADLANVQLVESDVNDNVVLSADAPVYTNVAAGETWTFVAYYIEGASDSARELIGVDVPASSQVTFGGNITGPALTVTLTGS